ncbi:MAG: hypothetical protein GF334_12365 [Candidatus Altiarchaeales archaeon]|nr:hypothetical protein [Candidatus Altiarchaeales archaeon]
MPVSLCTFTLSDEGDVFNLGTEDCYVSSRYEPGRTIYTVQSYYVNREGNRFYIDGTARGAAEKYVSDLAKSLGARELVSMQGPDGDMYVPDSEGKSGTLANPYTELSVSGAFCTAVEHDDQGGRYYGVIFTFEKPDYDVSDVPSGAILSYKDIDLGNLPGYIEAIPGPNFVTYTASAPYRGNDIASYPTSLADDVGFLPIHTADIVRGDIGSLGVVKTWNAESGVLRWGNKGFNEPDLYLSDMNVAREGAGLIVITMDFVKGR